MARDTKILQSILTGISDLREDVKRVEKKVDKNGMRIDNLTASLRYLEDDTPTLREFNKLEKRVRKIEKLQSPN